MNNKFIIYVDDNKDALDLMEFVLKSENRFILKGVQTESEMYDLIAQQIPDAVLLDLNLATELPGSILCRKLRSEYPYLPIIIYTSYDRTRTEKLIPECDNYTKIWIKSEVDVEELADKLAELVI